MKLIWHIIRKDIMRDRGALRMWAALYAAQVGLGVMLLQSDGRNRDWLQTMQLVSAGLVFLQSLTTYVLVARWVQADSPLGTDAHWITRPVARGRMLAAKLLGVALVFVVGPVLLLLPWWLGCSFDARGIFWTAIETMGWQLALVAPAFLAATLTNEMSRVLLWSALTWIALLMGTGFVRAAVPSEPLSPFDSTAGHAYTGAFLAACLLVIGSVVAAMGQYLSRRTQQAGIAVGILLVLVVLTGGLAPWDWTWQLDDLHRRSAPPEKVKAMMEARFEAGPVAPQADPDRLHRPGREAQLNTDLYIQGLPEHTGLWSSNVRHTWRWPDGTKVTRQSYMGYNDNSAYLQKALALPDFPSDPETQAWYAARRDAWLAEKGRKPGRMRRMIPPPPSVAAVRLYTMVPPSLITRLRDQPPAYDIVVPWVATEPVIRAQMPLVEGAKAGRDSHVARIVSFLSDGEGTSVKMAVLTTAPSIRDTGLWLSAAVRGNTSRILRSEFMAANPNGEFRQLMNEGNANGPRQLFVGGVRLSWSFGSLQPVMIVRDGKMRPLDPAWKEHYRVVWMAQEPVARVVSRASTDRLVYRPSIWEEFDAPPPKPKAD